jgi:hypothetical protein
MLPVSLASFLHGTKTLIAFFLIALSGTVLAQDSFMVGFLPNSADGYQIHTGDFNNDGIPDIVVGNNSYSAGLTVYLGNGDGTFKPPLNSAPGTSTWDMAVGDFNGDGKLDVAIVGLTSDDQGVLQIMLGNGDGTFRIGQTISFPHGSPNSITAGDFNGDGKTDLAVAQSSIYFYKGAGDGTFASIATATVGTKSPTEVRAGDFNGNGKTDIAVADPTNVYVMWNTGPFTFSTTRVGTFSNVEDITAVDVNQDGITDLITTYNTCFDSENARWGCAAWQVLLGVSGQSNLKTDYALPPTTNATLLSPDAADINGDGFNDIVALTGSSALVWLGNADGTFQSTPIEFPIASEASTIALAIGDFNRDGKIDFAVADPGDFTTAVLLNATPPAACTAGTLSPSVTECQPVDNTYSNSPLKFVAESTDTAHNVTSMQIYVNHALYYTVDENSLNYSLPLPDGDYYITTKAWDSSGANFVTERYVDIYTGAPGQTCATAPMSITVCSPTENETTTTSVQVLANSESSDYITAVNIYIDGERVYNDTSHTTWVNTVFSVTPGQHRITVKSFDASGNVFSKSLNIIAK